MSIPICSFDLIGITDGSIANNQINTLTVNTSISNTVVESNTFSAILTFTGNMTNTAVNQNICKSDFITGTSGVSEIQMRNVSISGNKITGTGPGVGGLLFRGDVTCEYVTISDNIIKIPASTFPATATLISM